MHKSGVLVLLAVVFSALAFLLFSSAAPVAQAQKPLPPNDRAHGLVYDGLQVPNPGECKGGFKVQMNARGQTRVYCTHGPDPAPANVDVKKRVPPVTTKTAYATGSSSTSVAGSGIVCEGDGVSGLRVQLLYAHASDVPDNYATYAASFQQWAAGVDAIFDTSAAQTGGSRHVRFVTDANCNAVIPDLTVSPTGDDSLNNTMMELQAQGYNRTDRKYLVFMDANVYCGIGLLQGDDQPGPTNANNSGGTYGRVDAGCWGSTIPAHELMHELGGVQMTAPHTDGNWHCTDGFDNMCDHSGSPSLTMVCADSSMDALFDCNHDDYYSTNPPAGSYLATHWNTANNLFLIKPQSASVDSVVTGKLKGNTFTKTDSFRPGDTVVVRAHVVDQNGASLTGTSVALTVNLPTGGAQCTLSATTDGTGTAQGSCSLPKKTMAGTWNGHVNSFSKAGYTSDTSKSVTDHNFKVQ